MGLLDAAVRSSFWDKQASCGFCLGIMHYCKECLQREWSAAGCLGVLNPEHLAFSLSGPLMPLRPTFMGRVVKRTDEMYVCKRFLSQGT